MACTRLGMAEKVEQSRCCADLAGQAQAGLVIERLADPATVSFTMTRAIMARFLADWPVA
jgi:hypothetical protein